MQALCKKLSKNKKNMISSGDSPYIQTRGPARVGLDLPQGLAEGSGASGMSTSWCRAVRLARLRRVPWSV